MQNVKLTSVLFFYTVKLKEIYNEICFLTYVAEQMRTKRYAKRANESYVHWIKSVTTFNNTYNCHR